MAFLIGQRGNLGQVDLTPTESLHRGIGAWITNERLFVGTKFGLKDEAAILAELQKAVPRGSSVPDGHPCRGISGKSICDRADIEAGYEAAIGIEQIGEQQRQQMLEQRRRERAAQPITKRQMVVGAGIGLVALLILLPPRRR